ncbi:hypothetical protein UFOVP522_21 [uncultured Caudovirales phage]|uniref:Uncharacterized protein n=1 Tax=uncultured Caudovirales phage TaxID=2100421 RepID=A0A6J5MY73_9CAUD|nr:hypothetical protein UFOVP522_21 [uncultured Caudovirales phage]CAB4154016.1 hypothetical protein UFOVP624_50 [uncultured Caudovirales phage]CAB4188352.1 hypothetical protein UFOVP1178_15 [uncultured Caudovirales phage]
MANKKISQLTLAVDVILPTDLMELSRDNYVGGYASEAISGDQLYEGMMVASPYLSAYHPYNQTFGAGVATAIDFKNIELQNFIDVPAPSVLVVDKSGIYKVDFTATINNNGGGSATGYHVGFYLKKNGTTNILNSSKFMTTPENNHVRSYSTSWLVQLKGGEYIEIFCKMDKANFRLITEAAHTGVVTPSSQVIMSRIG